MEPGNAAEPSEKSRPPDEAVPIVAIEHLYAARGDEVVLHDVSLRMEQGEQIALLGPNGCGKSTLLKVLTCELYPLPRPETRVRIFGRERWEVSELRRRMGVVSAELPGKPILMMTGFDAVLTGFFSSSMLWPNLRVTAAMRERAEEIVAMVGAERLRNKPVGAMSAGQQRRVMIGRALAGTTGAVQMLLLDEPSNALDLGAQQDLREMLRGLARAGVSMLLVTHQVSDIFPEIGRVLMMREGRKIADGPKAELLTSERMSDLFARQVIVEAFGGVYHAR